MTSHSPTPPPSAPRPPRRVWRWLLALILLIVLGVVALGAVLGTVLFTQPAGLRWLVSALPELTGGMITAQGPTGRLADRFGLAQICYADADADGDAALPTSTQVCVQGLQLQWRPAALLHAHQVHALHVQAQQVLVRLPADSPEAQKAQKAHADNMAILPTTLPVALDLEAVEIATLRITQRAPHTAAKDEAVVFAAQDLSGHLSWLGDRIALQPLALRLDETGPLTLSGEIHMVADRLDFAPLVITTSAVNEMPSGTLKLNGALALAGKDGVIELRADQMHVPLLTDAQHPPAVTALSGQAQWTGTLAHFAVNVAAQAHVHDLDLQLNTHGNGDLSAFDFEAIALKVVAPNNPTNVNAASSQQPNGQAQAGQELTGQALSGHGRLQWSPSLMADAQIQLKQLNPAVLVAGWSGQLNGEVTAQTRASAGAASQVEFTAQLHDSTLRGYPLALHASGVVGETQLNLNDFALNVAEGVLSGQAEYAWHAPQRVAGSVQLRAVNPGVFAPLWKGALNGQLQVDSAMQDASNVLHAQLDLQRSVLRDYPLNAYAQVTVTDWSGAQPAVKVDELRVQSADSRLSVHGQVTEPYAVAAELHSPDLAQLIPQSSGRIDLTAQLQGTLAAPHLVASGTASQLQHGSSKISSAKLAADLDIAQPSSLSMTLNEAQLGTHIAQASLNAQGVLKDHAIEFTANTDQGKVHVGFQGGFDVQRQEWGGELRQLALTPHLGRRTDDQQSWRWALEKPAGLLLGAKRLSLEQACLHADGGRACFEVIRAVLQPGIRVAWTLSQIDLANLADLLPQSAQQGAQLTGHADGDGELYWVDGDVGEARADLRLSAGSLTRPDLPPIQLQASHIALNQHNDTLHALLDLHAAQGSLSADVSAAPAAQLVQRELSGTVQVAIPDIGFAALFSREVSALAGHIDGEFAVHGPLQAPRLAGDVRLAEGRAHLVTPGIDLQNVELTLSGDGSGRLTIAGQAWSGQAAAAKAQSKTSLSQVITHAISQVVSPTATPAPMVLPPGAGELRVTGWIAPAGAPPGTRDGASDGTPDSTPDTTSGGTLGSTSEHRAGAANMAGTPNVDLTLTGNHFLALANADARIFVSPDLHVQWNTQGTQLSGRIEVPEARITPQGFGGGGQAVSTDQILVDADGQPLHKDSVAQSNSNFTAQVQLSLGDAVRFEGFGLTTRLAGSVDLNQQPLRDPTAVGELRLVDGRYKAYGQDLTIDNGRLIFDAGAVTSPGIDISAWRKPSDDVRVGVRVRGTLSQPQLTLESQPAMAREQQLSWLLFGRPLEQNSSSDRSALSSAALSLGLSGGGLIAQRLGKGIGLDNVQIGTVTGNGSDVSADATAISGSQAAQGATTTGTSNTQAQLTLGKYLTPKLYISYGVSLFQPGQTFRLLYDLGGGFKLQTESGVANGGDLLYTLERGAKQPVAKP